MVVIESLYSVNIKAANLEDTVNFYTDFLDFEIVSQNDKEAIVSLDQTNIRIIKSDASTKTEGEIPFLSFMLDVDDFTDAIGEIEENKIKIVSGPNEVGGGENILVLDPGGNIIELFYTE